MQGDTQFAKLVGEQDEVAEASRESIESPHQHVADVAGFHGGEELLQTGSLQVLARESGVSDDCDVSEVTKIRI
jgi:hypothetical protein